jgi:hypothetical protein
MTPPVLPIIDVTVDVYISPLSPPLPLFNQGLILGPSNVIPPYGSSLTLCVVSNGGTNYVVGDTVSVAGGTNGQLTVTAISAGGVVTGVQILQGGTGYTIATASCTGGSGTSLTVSIVTVGGGNSRLRQYQSSGAMLSDGFVITDPEYIAASLYFDQDADGPPPQILWVGTQNTSGGAILSAAVNNPGTGYAVGNIIGVVGAGGVLVVTGVSGGVVTGVSILQDGSGYSAGSNATLSNYPGASGLTVTLTVGNESLLGAAIYCAQTQTSWYGLYACGAQKTDHEALAGWAQNQQSNSDPVMYFYNTADSDVLNNNAGNIFAYLKALNYNRAIGIYSTVQGGTYPNNAYSGAAVMGLAFGLNTGLANSYFTLKFKLLVGVSTEPVTLTQANNIWANKGNLFGNFNNVYSYLTQGYLANGQFFDEVLNLDMLSADIQYSEMNLLTSNNSIPQTDPGESILIHAVNGAAQRAVVRGFIAPNQVWQGVTIINLQSGNPLPAGYLAQAYPYSQQSLADRDARKAQPIYLSIAEAGAVHSLTVGVYVQK